MRKMCSYKIDYNVVRLGEKFYFDWINSISNPRYYQKRILNELLKFYSKTHYGSKYNASEIMGFNDFRNNFPIVKYNDLEHLILSVLNGRYDELIAEKPILFGVTSGSMGKPKLIPLTLTELQCRIRIMLAGLSGLYFRFGGKILGDVLIVKMPICIYEENGLKFCYISGLLELIFQSILMNKNLNDLINNLKVEFIPKTRRDYNLLFEYAYKFYRDVDVKLMIGSAPLLIFFAWYLRKKYNLIPKDLWDIKVVLATGVPYIHDYYSDLLYKLYGDQISIVELYGSTEALIAMQIDDNPYVAPFYNQYFLEVKVNGKVKMLFEMVDGEIGSLIISNSILPRYYIGDLIECIEEGKYFKLHGRDKIFNRLRINFENFINRITNLIYRVF